MVNNLISFLAGIKMTIVSALCLLLSLSVMIYHIESPFNPAWGTIVISGLPIVFHAFSTLIKHHRISSPFLITIAMAAAISIGELFAAGEVALIIAIGEILEDMTIDKAKKGLERLLDLTPTTGRKVLADGRDKVVLLSDIKDGDILRVLPGETIPVDGIITKGNTSVNQAALTGESLPVDKEAGEAVMAGTINCFGAFELKVTAIKNTYLQRMIKLVEEAQDKKAPSQKIIDKWAAILVPTALIIALITYFITGEIIRAVTVLVVFCPCALVLATPTSIMAAIGQAAKYGVLIKSGAALETMGKVNAIVFDKTGTLTSGTLQVVDVISLDKKLSSSHLLALTASLECCSEHILAKAIVQKAQADKLSFFPIDDFQMEAGKGVYGSYQHTKVWVGNLKFMRENNITISDAVFLRINNLQNEGKAIVIIAQNTTICGIIALADTVRPESRSTLSTLQKFGIESFILSGDNQATVRHLAQQLEIKHIFYELLPTEKVEKIRELQHSGKIVCMTGDGINDAPAMKIANVGVAMAGIGSDITIDASDIAFINDSLANLPYVYKLAQKTITTIQTNIILSMCLNFIGITLSVMGILTPITGAILHNAGSVLVVLNAARLYDKKI